MKIAINGFGRIGRAAYRAAQANPREFGERLRRSTRIDANDIEVVAVNDLGDKEQLANLLKYDSVYGVADADIEIAEPATAEDADNYAEGAEKNLIINGKSIPFFSEKDPTKLPWGDLDVDVVLECTGVFADFEKSQAHIDAGAKKVIISANAKGDGPTVVLGTESARRLFEDPAEGKPTQGKTSEVSTDLPAGKAGLTSEVGELGRLGNIVSNASCTTNCISPIMQILDDTFGVEKALMTTDHAYTSTQNLVDGPSRKDLRRARAAGVNTIPTTTGSAKATGKVVTNLEGKFDGIAIRVPVPCGSISDVVAVLEKDVTAEEINKVFKEAAESEEYKGIIDYSEEPLVSTDIIGNPYSAVFDAPFTRVVGGNLVKILAWYDNEWAYANRLVELAQIINSSL